MKTKLLFLFLLSWNFSIAQNFVEVPDINIPGLTHSWFEFADVDGDDDLDLLIQGDKNDDLNSRYTKLFKNDGSGNFTEVENSPFTTVYIGCLAFADVDGDDDLDVIISGINGKGLQELEKASTKLYLNDGTGEFTESLNSPFVNVSHGEIEFADVDGDWDLDVLITGINGSSVYAKLYENNGTGEFTERMDTPFEGVARSSIEFADVDGDCDQDVLITGDTKDFSAISKLYLNDGSGNFQEKTNTPFIAVTSGSVAFADVDGDNDQDVLITGTSFIHKLGQASVLYMNDGMGNFTENKEATFEGVRYGIVEFADIDGDLDQDVFISGRGEHLFSGLYINDGLGHFTLSIENEFYPVEFSCASFADVDNDSDLDLFLTGFNPDPPYPDWANAILYINDREPVINPVEKDDPLSRYNVYPNPITSSDPINISNNYNITDGLKLSIIDGDGRLVLQENICIEPGNDNIKISPSFFKSGLYYLRIQHRQDVEVIKLIID